MCYTDEQNHGLRICLCNGYYLSTDTLHIGIRQYKMIVILLDRLKEDYRIQLDNYKKESENWTSQWPFGFNFFTLFFSENGWVAIGGVWGDGWVVIVVK